MSRPRKFAGDDYVPARDDARLAGQLLDVFNLMKDGKRRTLQSIADAIGAPAPSVSAQLRHLRKPRHGGHTINKYHLGAGLYEYELIENNGKPAALGFSDAAKAVLRRVIMLEFGLPYLASIDEMIARSAQQELRDAVSAKLLRLGRFEDEDDWRNKIQRMSELPNES